MALLLLLFFQFEDRRVRDLHFHTANVLQVVFAHQGVVLDSIFHVGSELAFDVVNRHALEGVLFNTLPSRLDFTSCEPQTLDILRVENLLS